MKRFVISLSAILILALSLAGSAGAEKVGNSANAKLCQKDGWQQLYRSDGTTFADQGVCVSYGAQGGAILDQAPRSMSVAVTSYGVDASRCLVTVGVSGFLSDSTVTSEWLDFWLYPDGSQYSIGSTWPLDIQVGSDGTGNKSAIAPNNQVSSQGAMVITQITVEDLTWGPTHIAC